MAERRRLYSPRDTDVLQRQQIRLSFFQKFANGENTREFRDKYIYEAGLFVQSHDYVAALRNGLDTTHFYENRAEEIYKKDLEVADKFKHEGVKIKIGKETKRVYIDWLIADVQSNIADILDSE